LYIVVHMAAANVEVRHRDCLDVDCIHFVLSTAETVVVRTEAVRTLASMVAEVKQKVLEEEEEVPNTDSEKPLRRRRKDVIDMVVEVTTSTGRDKVPTAFGFAGTCASLRSKDGRKKRSNKGTKGRGEACTRIKWVKVDLQTEVDFPGRLDIDLGPAVRHVAQ
jgi:hypothetical protein